MHEIDAAAVTAWTASTVRALDELRADIDRMNVYPVADSDTGSNMLATARGGLEALEPGFTGTAGEALLAVSKGAVGAARGNSGVILSQFWRGLALSADGNPTLDAAALAAALASAAQQATRSVARPAAGTMLTVLAAASQAAGSAGTSLDAVVAAAVEAAADALARTPSELDVLAVAGVVDAGGRGILAVLDALAQTVTGTPAPPRKEFAGTPNKSAVQEPSETSHYGWEVMYHLDRVQDPSTLADELAGLGDCVTIADDGDRHAIHVHCDDIGAAVEAGLRHGVPSNVRVEALPADRQRRALLAVVDTAELADVLREEGVGVLAVEPDQHVDQSELDRAIAAQRADHVTVLAANAELTAGALEAADIAVEEGHDVVVIPCASSVQVLAAVAVHDVSRRAADDVVAMAEAAAAMRRGELTVADEDAITWIGKVFAGDLIGFLDDEVVIIEPANSERSRAEVAVDLANRMLVAGGELITVISGGEADESIVDETEQLLARSHPEVDVVSYAGKQSGVVLTLGVE